CTWKKPVKTLRRSDSTKQEMQADRIRDGSPKFGRTGTVAASASPNLRRPGVPWHNAPEAQAQPPGLSQLSNYESELLRSGAHQLFLLQLRPPTHRLSHKRLQRVLSAGQDHPLSELRLLPVSLSLGVRIFPKKLGPAVFPAGRLRLDHVRYATDKHR